MSIWYLSGLDVFRYIPTDVTGQHLQGSAEKIDSNQIIMADSCTLSKEGFLDCGSSRGRTETVFLYECRDDVTTHLNIVFCRVQI